MRLISLVFLLVPALVFAQEKQYKSIHEIQNAQYDTLLLPDYNNQKRPIPHPEILNNNLNKTIMGYYPYWINPEAYLNFDYSALTSLAYFSFDVDTATGSFTTIRKWMTDPAIDYAKAKGLDIILVATNFGATNNRAILSDTNKVNKLISDLIYVTKFRGGDGINIDFESLPGDVRDQFTEFLRKLRREMDLEMPGSELSVAAPAVDWNGAWDIAAIAEVVDYIMIMGYGYYWTGSAYAGPVAPLEGATQNVTRSVTEYLKYAPAEKILLGVPWYGIEWITSTAEIQGAVISPGVSRTYTLMEGLADLHGKEFSEKYSTPWIKYYYADQWHEAWYDDSLSLALKYNLVNDAYLGGIGIWALGYEGGGTELWQGILAAFTEVSTIDNADREFDLISNLSLNGGQLLFNSQNNFAGKYKIYSINGRLVKAGDLAGITHKINVSALATGAYLIIVTEKDQRQIRKFIK